jgi:CDP-2,3-bis-(O-geranylgeranyl)-sn-glycerol synthase
MAILTAGIMQYIYNNSAGLRATLGFDFSSINFIVYGFLSGMGALLGDAIKSFFKRRVNIKPGSTWFPFDQIDYIVGGILFLMPLIMLTLVQYLITFFVWFGMHLISTYIGYLLKLKDKPI